MSELLWRALAKVLSIPTVAQYLIKRSQRTPYFHLPGYMNRYWLFNAYSGDRALDDKTRNEKKHIAWLPSIRIHHILRADNARDMHDHPWNARTIILQGFYVERRLEGDKAVPYDRNPGDTAAVRFGEYHSIDYVSPGGVYTMFLTWKYMGTWGFLVNGRKVPHREYDKSTS